MKKSEAITLHLKHWERFPVFVWEEDGELVTEVDGVVYVKAPTRETYNRTFAVVKKYRLPSVSTEVLLEPTRGGPQMSAPSEQ